MNHSDRFNITTFDKEGAPDMLISNVSIVTLQKYIKKFKARNIEFYVVMCEEETR